MTRTTSLRVQTSPTPTSPSPSPSPRHHKLSRSPSTLNKISPKLKMEELFVVWLSQASTKHKLDRLLNPVVDSMDTEVIEVLEHPSQPASKLALSLPSSPPPRSPKPSRQKLHPSSPSSSSSSPTATSQFASSSSSSSSSPRPSSASLAIPRFFFPTPPPISDADQAADTEMIDQLFALHPRGVSMHAFEIITREICGFPTYFTELFFSRIASPGDTTVSKKRFLTFWNTHMATVDITTRFFNLVRQPENDYIQPADFSPLLTALLELHPALEFLKATPEFQEKYAETVVIRIFYKANRAANNRLTLKEIRRSDLLDQFIRTDQEADINQVTEYFSYEHFYVLYCKFWELDTDHDQLIDRDDLLRYGDHALTYRAVDRIFSQIPRPFASNSPLMSYEDFVWFCLSEENKRTPTSIEYWFRVADVDGDGVISTYELQYFYEEQLQRMDSLMIEAVLFEDILCQIHDMVKPAKEGFFYLTDFKRCPLTGPVFNILFNLNKFINSESRDPVAIRYEQDTAELTDWDRFARVEYDRLAAEDEEEDEYFDDEWPYAMEGGNNMEAPF